MKCKPVKKILILTKSNTSSYSGSLNTCCTIQILISVTFFIFLFKSLHYPQTYTGLLEFLTFKQNLQTFPQNFILSLNLKLPELANKTLPTRYKVCFRCLLNFSVALVEFVSKPNGIHGFFVREKYNNATMFLICSK